MKLGSWISDLGSGEKPDVKPRSQTPEARG